MPVATSGQWAIGLVALTIIVLLVGLPWLLGYIGNRLGGSNGLVIAGGTGLLIALNVAGAVASGLYGVIGPGAPSWESAEEKRTGER